MGKLETTRTYPWTTELGGQEFTFRLMSGKDKKAAVTFTKELSADDILYLMMDIRKTEVIEETIGNIKKGRAVVVMALDGKGKLAGYASLFHNEMLWTRHQGEIRLFVLDKYRGIGLGRHLATEAMQVALDQDLELIVVNIPREQPHVRAMLERIGFKVEALLTDWLMDQKGRTHDLIVMSHHTSEFL